ncbi:MAG TPA: hypothetical protein VFV95_11995 [Vicinamibacterales bacterium]|nr:hypothetical protein [Vicinamibacterales bacterium]
MKHLASIASAFVVIAIVGIVGWRGFAALFTEPERAAHRKNGSAYAARDIQAVGTLPAELAESSGVAVSRTQPGVLWSHNDSGDSPNLYAIDRSGRLLASIRVGNSVLIDWEDMSSGPCPRGIASSRCVYIADTGNNSRARTAFTVYVVAEPMLGSTGERASAAAAQSFRFRYPDRPHDSEAIAVHPEGDVTIVTKGQTGTIDFFGVDAAAVERAIVSREVVAADLLGSSGITPDGRIGRLATGAAISPDGTMLAVRTYNEIFFYAAAQDERGRRQWRDRQRPCYLGDVEPQGEAIDYLDNETLLLTSESRLFSRGRISRVQC